MLSRGCDTFGECGWGEPLILVLFCVMMYSVLYVLSKYSHFYVI